MRPDFSFCCWRKETPQMLMHPRAASVSCPREIRCCLCPTSSDLTRKVKSVCSAYPTISPWDRCFVRRGRNQTQAVSAMWVMLWTGSVLLSGSVAVCSRGTGCCLCQRDAQGFAAIRQTAEEETCTSWCEDNFDLNVCSVWVRIFYSPSVTCFIMFYHNGWLTDKRRNGRTSQKLTKALNSC